MKASTRISMDRYVRKVVGEAQEPHNRCEAPEKCAGKLRREMASGRPRPDQECAPGRNEGSEVDFRRLTVSCRCTNCTIISINVGMKVCVCRIWHLGHRGGVGQGSMGAFWVGG